MPFHFGVEKCGDKTCPCNDGDACHYVDHDGTKAILLSHHIHERNLRTLRCLVSGHTAITLHHCHGGSMLELGEPFSNSGMAQRSNPFFQIPLHAQYHVGEFGVDTGMGKIKSVKQWEETFGTQRLLLDELDEVLPYDLWQQAALYEEWDR